MSVAETFVAVGPRGTMSLPAGLRRKLHLDQPGAQVQVSLRDDGVIELRPMVAVPADQLWFWSEDWQRKEREVDAAIKAGDTQTFESGEDFIKHLESLG
jgi:hypothetical protein